MLANHVIFTNGKHVSWTKIKINDRKIDESLTFNIQSRGHVLSIQTSRTKSKCFHHEIRTRYILDLIRIIEKSKKICSLTRMFFIGIQNINKKHQRYIVRKKWHAPKHHFEIRVFNSHKKLLQQSSIFHCACHVLVVVMYVVACIVSLPNYKQRWWALSTRPWRMYFAQCCVGKQPRMNWILGRGLSLAHGPKWPSNHLGKWPS